MIKLLNDVTGGHLLLWKVLVTSVVVALAGLQVAVAARFWGRPSLIAVSPGTAVRIHRTSGRIALTLGVIVAQSPQTGSNPSSRSLATTRSGDLVSEISNCDAASSGCS